MKRKFKSFQERVGLQTYRFDCLCHLEKDIFGSVELECCDKCPKGCGEVIDTMYRVVTLSSWNEIQAVEDCFSYHGPKL